MTTRDSIFRGFVRGYNPATGIVTCTIPKLYGRATITARPAVGSPAEIPGIAAPTYGSTIFVFFDGGADNSPFWMPRVLDAAFDGLFVKIAGDTMTGALIGTDITLSGALEAASALVTGDVAVNGGDLTTSATTFNLLASPTTVNIAQAATTVSIGAVTGTTTVRNALTVSGATNVAALTASGIILANSSGTNEQVTITVTGSPTGGTFTLFIAGLPVVLNYNSTTGSTSTAINAALGGGSVSVSGGTFPFSSQTITYSANYAGSDVPLPVLAVNALTGGSSPSVSFSTPVPGAGSVSAATVATGAVSAGRAYLGSVQTSSTSSMSAANGTSPLILRVGDSQAALTIPASSSTTNERASISMGTWLIGQDVALNNGLDFFIWNGSTRLLIGTGGLITVGNSAETMRFLGDNSFLSFYEATGVSRRGYLQGQATGVVLSSEAGALDMYGSTQLLRLTAGYALLNGQMRIGTWPTASQYAGLVDRASGAANNYMIMADITDTFISSPGAAGTIRIRPANNGTDAETIFSTAGSICAQQVQAGRNGGSAGGGATTNEYFNATFYANPAVLRGGATGHTASIAFHPGAVAPQLRVAYNDGNIYNRAADGTSNNPFTASAFTVASTQRIKKNITDWPRKSLGAASPSALGLLTQLRVITFDRDEPGLLKEIPAGRRGEAYQRLAQYTARNGLPPYELPDHDCSIHDCDGTPDDPCFRVLNARHSEYGLIAEEVFDVLPEAVVLDAERKPYSINYSMIDAVLLAAVKELTDRLATVEATLAP